MKFVNERTGNVLCTENPTTIALMQASSVYTQAVEKTDKKQKKEKK